MTKNRLQATESTTLLVCGNRALREGKYSEAISFYCEALKQVPELEKTIAGNINLARRKLKFDSQLKEKNASIDIVVPVFNALEDVKRCLNSLERHTDGYHVKIIVVNDGSDAETTQWLRKRCQEKPIFTLIENSLNAGYTCAVNIGLRSSSAEYVITQNSDTIVTPGWLAGMVRCMESSAKIGVVGPLSNAASWQNIPQLRDESGAFAVNALPLGMDVEGMAQIVAKASQRIYPRLPFINGFCFMIRRAVIDTIGYMDEENFPMGYGEENDYCIRASDAGFQLVIADDVFVFHAKSKSFGHNKRLQLSANGDMSLRKKHTDAKIDCKITNVSNTEALDKIRNSISIEINKKAISTSKKYTYLRSILFILPVGAGGGGGHSVIQEAAELRRLGVNANVAVMHLNLKSFLDTYGDIEGINELLIGYHTSKESETQLRNLEFAKDYEVIVATLYSTVSLVAMLTNKFPEVLPAYYIQDYEPYFFEEGSNDWKIAYESYSLLKNAILFAKTNWVVEKVKSIHGVNVRKVKPSIDHSVYHPIVRKAANVVIVSAMIRPSSKRRGAARTMRTLKRLAETFKSDVLIKIFGCTNEDLISNNLVHDFEFENSGVASRVQVAEILGLSDIFIDLSDYQAFGRTALEAMACGATAIVPKIGGSDEYAIDDINSLVVDTLDEELVFKRLAELINNPEKLAKMKNAGIETASRYSLRSAALSELTLFSDALNKINFSRPVAKRNYKRDLLLMPGLMANNLPAGSGYVRLLLPYANLAGWNVSTWFSRKLPPVGCADAIFIQREMGGVDLDEFNRWACNWKSAGGRIFYDIDDNLLDAEELAIRINAGLEIAKKRTERIKILASQADVVTVSMPDLIDLLTPFSKNIRYVPNYLDEAAWWISRERPQGADCYIKSPSDTLVRIGYIGTPTHSQDLEIISEAVKRIELEFGGMISVEIIGGFQDSKILFGNPIALPKNTDYPNFVEWLGKRINWDIGLIPLLDDKFNRSKSYLKFLEYSALNLAIICSDVPTYSHVAKNEVNCLIAKNNPDDWYEKIKRLIIDANLRKRLAHQSRIEISESHTIQKNSENFLSVLNSAFGT